jgi:hypothetical protein
MQRPVLSIFIVLALAAAVSAAPKFIAVWKDPELQRLNFAGKKVAALAITDDLSLQMSAEEALTRELSARGVSGIASYRIVPREELKSAEKAKAWFERASIDGVVALRWCGRTRRRPTSPTVWTSSYYQSFWGYYGAWLEQRLRRRFGNRDDHARRRDPDLQRPQRQADLGRHQRPRTPRSCSRS